ncbi:hypothetical protein [Rosistilla ulvae]|uniref:hypothetical protein n=1 Tax=Rosistilla ulvae TaxID=1930277 RepID=UPI001C54DADA|nr:hypothetical protein [Rosistilla ulvae]
MNFAPPEVPVDLRQWASGEPRADLEAAGEDAVTQWELDEVKLACVVREAAAVPEMEGLPVEAAGAVAIRDKQMLRSSRRS